MASTHLSLKEGKLREPAASQNDSRAPHGGSLAPNLASNDPPEPFSIVPEDAPGSPGCLSIASGAPSLPRGQRQPRIRWRSLQHRPTTVHAHQAPPPRPSWWRGDGRLSRAGPSSDSYSPLPKSRPPATPAGSVGARLLQPIDPARPHQGNSPPLHSVTPRLWRWVRRPWQLMTGADPQGLPQPPDGPEGMIGVHPGSAGRRGGVLDRDPRL